LNYYFGIKVMLYYGFKTSYIAPRWFVSGTQY